MYAYWLLFTLVAFAALFERPYVQDRRRGTAVLALLTWVIALMVGLRFHVGADYEAYLGIFETASNASLTEALAEGEAGYQLVNWIIAQLDGSMWQVNLIVAAIFSWGLYRLCRLQQFPILSLLVAVPYLVVVVAMGYTRQAAAIGLIMAGLASLTTTGSIPRFIAYVAVAALFHKTAVIVLPLAIFAGHRNRFLNVLAVAAAAYGLYTALLQEAVGGFVENYFVARYSSEGAAIRVAMIALPSLLLLLAGKRFQLDEYERRLWRMFALVSLACVPALAIIPSSTAVDRVALYLLPIQLVILGRMPIFLNSETTGRISIMAYAFAVLFVWLNFAAHSQFWIPYRMVPLG